MANYYYTVRLAGHVLRVGTLYLQTGIFLRDFIEKDADPEFTVEMKESDIRREWRRMLESPRYERDFVNRLPGYYFESFALNRKISDRMLCFGTQAFHGSAAVVDGRCFVFSAESGVGKSTWARMWAKHFGKRAYILNDDKPFLHVVNGKVTAYGSPWDGKHHAGRNAAAPLAAIGFLERGDAPGVQRMSPGEALEKMRFQVFRPEAPEDFEKANLLLKEISESIPAWRVRFTLDPSGIDTVYQSLCMEVQP